MVFCRIKSCEVKCIQPIILDMRQRPWPIVILAILHIFAPIANIFFSGILSGFGLVESFTKAFEPQLLLANWYTWLLPICAGLSIYACKKWSFYVYVFCMLALFGFNIKSFDFGQGYISYIYIILLFGVNLVVVTYFLVPAVRNLYFNRRMRWWENHTRYTANFKCHWQADESEKTVEGLVSNLSLSGLFLKSEKNPDNDGSISVTFEHKEIETKLMGKAILHDKLKEKGFGMQFIHNAESLKAVKEIIADLETEGLRATNLKGLYEDSLTYWLRTLFKSGKGLIPKN